MQKTVSDAIESMISVCREHAGNVNRWRDGRMALVRRRMIEAGKRFAGSTVTPTPTDTPMCARTRDRRTCRTPRAQ